MYRCYPFVPLFLLLCHSGCSSHRYALNDPVKAETGVVDQESLTPSQVAGGLPGGSDVPAIVLASHHPTGSGPVVHATPAIHFPVAIPVPSVIASPEPPARVIRLEELTSQAVAGHPAIREKQAMVSAAQGRLIQEGLRINPVAQYQADELGNDASAGLHTWSLSQTCQTADKRQLRRSVAWAQMQSAHADLAMEKLRIQTRVAIAFRAALIAQMRVDVTRRMSELSDELVEQVQNQMEAQEASRLQLLQAKTLSSQNRVTAENAEAAYVASLRKLWARVGDRTVPDRVRLEGDVDPEPLDDWQSLTDDFVALSPQMRIAVAQLEVARRSVCLAHANATPNVTSQLGVGFDSGTDDPYGRFGVSVPIPWHNRNQGNIRTAHAQVRSAQAAIQRVEAEITNRLAGAVGVYEQARSRVRVFHDEVKPQAEEALALAREAFEVGEINYLSVLAAQTALFRAEIGYLDTLGQAATAASEIEGFLAGGEFADVTVSNL